MNPGGYWYGYGYQQPQVGTLDLVLVLSFGLGADLGNGYMYSQPMVHFSKDICAGASAQGLDEESAWPLSVWNLPCLLLSHNRPFRGRKMGS